MYEELVKNLRMIADHTTDDCDGAAYGCVSTMLQAADAIEELSREIDIDNAAMTAMDAAMPRWIPVTERLPEKYEVVIALNKRGKQRDIDKAYWNGFRFYRHYRKAPYSNVTHWMPLPEPPKEET